MGGHGQVYCSFICDGRLDFDRLLMALRALAKLVPRVSSPCILGSLPALSPVLLQQMSHDTAAMRLAAVTLCAEMYPVVGDHLYPHLQSLREPQRKLVTMYINKRERGAMY
jgi:hypothetical protein